MRIIEGTVEEIVEYQQRTGLEPTVGDDSGEVPTREPAPARTISGDLRSEDEDSFYITQHIYARAKSAETARRCLDVLGGAMIDGAEVEVGKSKQSATGVTNYVMIRDRGPRRYGAVAYIWPGRATVELRLREEDVDPSELSQLRVRDGEGPYGLICDLIDDESVELARRLVDRALAKVRVAD